jgi:hypothetical protein
MTTDPNLKVQIDWENRVIDIRQSAISSFLDCKRKFYWEYVEGIEFDWAQRPGGRPWTNADVGTAFHLGMERYYQGLPEIEVMACAADHALEQDLGLNGKGKPFDEDLVRIMLEGHIADLAESGADVGEKVIALEEPVMATVKDVQGWTINIHGKIDRRIETDDGLHIIDDTKSVGPFEEIDSYLPQLMRYALLVRSQHGWRADRVRTTQVRRVKRTGDGPFFDRPWVPVNEEMYRVAADSLRGTLDDIVQTLESGNFYEHRTGECSWKCRVEDICRAQVRGDDPEIIVDIHYRPKEAK